MQTALQRVTALPVRIRGPARAAANRRGVWALPALHDASAPALPWLPRGGSAAAVPETSDGADADVADSTGANYFNADGVALIGISGLMSKSGITTDGDDIIIGCSTIAARLAVRSAAVDPDVRAIVLHICSPGGRVDGTSDLANDVAAAAKLKPTDAYITDFGTSAAYLVASQCRNVFANATALIGSIGVMSVLTDDTAMQQDLGLKLTAVGSGEYKAMLADGKVTPQAVAEVQRQVDGQSAVFFAAVAAGRGSRIADMPAVTDGRVHVAAEAKQLGLIDQIVSFDAAVAALVSEITPMDINEFETFATANPDAVKKYTDAGHATGRDAGTHAERARFAALTAAFPERHQFVLEQFAKGHDAAAANVDFVAVLKAENQTLHQQIATAGKPGGSTATPIPPAAAAATAHAPLATSLTGVDAPPAVPGSEASLAASGRAAGDEFVQRQRRMRGLS